MASGYRMESAAAVQALRTAVYRIIRFLSSARYQIEGREFERRALRIMNKYYRGLYNVLMKLDGVTIEGADAWGTFSVTGEDAE